MKEMKKEPQLQPRRGIEFLDHAGEPLSPTGDEEHRHQSQRQATVRRSWLLLAVSAVMSAGAVVTIASVFVTQMTFHPLSPGEQAGPTYAVDGLGRYRLVGRMSARVSFGGHAPAFGEIAVAALNAGVACFAAGLTIAALACENLEDANFPGHTRAVGFWLLAVGASLGSVAALVYVASIGLHAPADGERGMARR